MKRFLIRFISTIGVMMVLGIGAVIALTQYYHSHNVFPLGVMINDLYCTGMTVEEAAKVFDASYDLHKDKFIVRTLDGDLHELSFDEFGITVSYEPAVAEYMQRYNRSPFQWIEDLLGISKPVAFLYPPYDSTTVFPTYYWDGSLIEAKLSEADWLNENLYDNKKTVSIEKSAAAGYILVDETKDLLVREAAIELICNQIVSQLSGPKHNLTETNFIDLSTGKFKEICYQNIPYTNQMKDTLSKWEGVSEFQNFHMTYQFGDREEKIDANIVADWMALDENGNIVFDENNVPVLDETIIKEYVAYLSATYNTVGIEREFQATSGDIVKVPGGSYGNEIDENAEYEFLLNAFLNKQSGTRVPEYTSEAWEKGSNDIGDTYIEVDMGDQHMYYYADGEIVIDTPVVTGNTSRRWDTPAKVCYVYFKQRNRVLRGANYATPVKYWMAVDGHIGIHDATWRSDFGGEIYKTNGSHGCINTPFEIMTELYDMVELGTPVIMFY